MTTQPKTSAFDAVRQYIVEMASYQTPEQLRRHAESDYGCGYEEALEMAYENLLQTAKMAKKKLPRPRPSTIPISE